MKECTDISMCVMIKTWFFFEFRNAQDGTLGERCCKIDGEADQ